MVNATKLSLLDRLFGRNQAVVDKREAEEAEAQAACIGRAVAKAQAAIVEARQRKATDTVFLEMSKNATIASGVFNGALGLTTDELALLPKPLLDEVLAHAER